MPFVDSHRWMAARLENDRLVLLTLARVARPYLEQSERVKIERVADRLTKVSANFGYMEQARIAPVFSACKARGLDIDNDETSFFYADPKILRASDGMPRWQRALFRFLQRNARPIPDELEIRPERRVEVGLRVEV